MGLVNYLQLETGNFLTELEFVLPFLCKKSAVSAAARIERDPQGTLRTLISYQEENGEDCPDGFALLGNPYGLGGEGEPQRIFPLTPPNSAARPQDGLAAEDESLVTAFDLTLDGETAISVTGTVPIAAEDFLNTIILAFDVNGSTYRLLVGLLDGDTTATGSEGPEGIEVGAGNDSVAADAGDDTTYKWKPGDLVYDGGPGSDTLSFQAATGDPFPTPSTQTLVVNLAAGGGQSPYGGALTLSNVENIVGTSQADSITGDDGPNVIGDGFFDSGADTINAMGGDDLVRLAVLLGDFSIDGGDGFDELSFPITDVTAAVVTVVLDLLNPALNTGPLAGGSFINFEKFSASATGPDIFVFGGSNGDDVVVGQPSSALFPANEPFEDILSGRGGNDTISGRLGRDSLDGGDGADSLDGGGGNDSLTGGGGNDTIAGGQGTDRAIFAGPQSSYTIAPAAQGVIVSGPDGTDSVGGVELLQFDDQAVETPVQAFVGAASHAEGGTRFMVFTISLTRDSAQDVTVTASTSDGTAQAGSDYVAISSLATIFAGATSAVFTVEILNDTVAEGDESFTLTLSNPVNGVLSTQSSATGTIVDNDQGEPPPPEVDQTIAGGEASELIFGSALRELVQGNGGDDTVFAGDANDVLEGGDGRDFLVAESGADLGRGGNGDDVLFGGSGADSLLGEAGVDFLFGEAGANTLDGGAGNDRIHINREDIIAAGGEGVFDVLVVLDAAGPLTINLGNSANQNTTGSGPVVTGIEAVDASLSNQPVNVTGAVLNGFGNVLFTSAFADTVTGSSAIDIILGGGGGDILNGSGGNDTLIADAGSDTLTGGAGADDFFHPGGASTMRVADFAPGSDQVVLLTASGLTPAAALAQTVQQGADAVLALGSGGTIILAGVQVAALSAGDFEIV